MSGSRAAAVKVAVHTGAGTCYAALRVATDIDDGNVSGERGGGGRCGCLGDAGLKVTWVGLPARRGGSGEEVQAGCCIAVVDGSAALRAMLVGFEG